MRAGILFAELKIPEWGWGNKTKLLPPTSLVIAQLYVYAHASDKASQSWLAEKNEEERT